MHFFAIIGYFWVNSPQQAQPTYCFHITAEQCWRSGMVVYVVLAKYHFASNPRTTILMVLPSALPANCLVATPITLPMSCGPVAPT